MIKAFIGKDFAHNPSPYGRWLAGQLVDVGEGYVEVDFTVRPEMTNPSGMLHGGVMTGMIDDVMGINFYILGVEYFYPTINLNIDFFSAAKPGDVVHVRTEVVKQGRTIINLKGIAKNDAGRTLAQASSNIAKSNMKIPG